MLCFTAVTTLLYNSTDAAARQLTPEEALAAARQTAAKTGQRMKMMQNGQTMQLAYTGSDGNVNCFYVFNHTTTTTGDNSGNGFVIVSADDLAPALLGYVDNGEFNYTDAPDAMKWWLTQYEQAIGQAARTGKAISRQNEAQTDRPAIPHLMQTQWAQGAPYYNLCPTLSSRRCVTGCVATAMAQVMKYHRWPEQGTGSNTYWWNNGGKELSADFSSTTYQWDNMLNNYNRLYLPAQSTAVATLMYHCGMATGMQYNPDGSGTTDFTVAPAFINYFGYDKALSLQQRMFYTDDEWEDLVYNELAEGRPVYYSGVTKQNEGHAFICDGYSGDGLYHFNWGWGGSYDGSFALTGAGALNPDGTGTGGGTIGYGFTEGQSCIIGLQRPQPGSELSIIIAAYYGYSLSGATGNVTRQTNLRLNGSFFNMSAAPVNVEMGVMFRSTTTDDVYYDQITSAGIDVLEGIQYLPCTPASVVKNGTYEVLPVYRRAGSNNKWQQVQIPADNPIPTITVTGQEPSLAMASQAYIGNGDNYTTPDNVELHFSLSAQSAINNRLIVAFIFNEGGGQNITQMADYVTLAAGETRDFTWRDNLSADLQVGKTYLLQLYDYSQNSWLVPSAYGTIYFKVVEDTGISSPLNNSDTTVDVYSMSGMLLRRSVKPSEALNQLPAGMYIVGGKKIMKQ